MHQIEEFLAQLQKHIKLLENLQIGQEAHALLDPFQVESQLLREHPSEAHYKASERVQADVSRLESDEEAHRDGQGAAHLSDVVLRVDGRAQVQEVFEALGVEIKPEVIEVQLLGPEQEERAARAPRDHVVQRRRGELREVESLREKHVPVLADEREQKGHRDVVVEREPRRAERQAQRVEEDGVVEQGEVPVLCEFLRETVHLGSGLWVCGLRDRSPELAISCRICGFERE